MATTKFIEAGTAATQDFKFWTTAASDTGGAITSDAQAILGSVRSIKAAGGASPGGASVQLDNGTLADAGRRISFGFRFTGTLNTDAPAGDFLDFFTSGLANAILSLGLTNAGLLKLWTTDGGTVYGTGSVALTASTDYRISFVYTVSSTTVNTFEVRLYNSSNALLDSIIVSNVTLPRTGMSALFFGVFGHNSPGANVTFYSAHWYIDDGTTGDPGNIRVTAKRPNANGTTNGFTTQIGSGGSGYGSGHSPQVNERPLSITNGWSVITVATAITEEYNIENASTGDVDITGATIVDYTGWVYTKALNAETAQIIVNNVNSNISVTTSAAMFTKIAASATYPAGTGTDIGEISAAIATTISLYECGVMVAYIPAVSSGRGGYMPTMGFFG